MKLKLLTLAFAALLLLAPATAERQIEFSIFEGIFLTTGEIQATNTPVTDVDVAGFVCQQANCESFTSQLYNGATINTGNSNVATVTFPTQRESFGYAHIFYDEDGDYIPWIVRSDYFGTNANDPTPAINPVYLTKVQQCVAPIDSFSVTNDVLPNQPVQFEMMASLDSTVYSPIVLGGLVGFQAPQAQNSYSIDTQAILIVRDQNNNIIYQETKDISIPFSGQQRVMFEYTPDQVGRYTATVTTRVPDVTCLDDAPQTTSKDFSVIGDTTELCYAIGNGLQAQPLGQRPGEDVTISQEALAACFDTFGRLTPQEYEIEYRITDPNGNTQTIVDQFPAPSNPVDFEIRGNTVQFAVPGEHTIQSITRPINSPYADTTFDTQTIVYQVQQGEPEPNTEPTLNVPDVFAKQFQTNIDNLYFLPDFAFDPEQDSNTLDYTIVSQTNPSVVVCEITNNVFGCDIQNQNFGQSVVEIRVTDNQGASSSDLVTVTIQEVTACQDGIDNDNDGLTDLADPGCDNLADNDETDPVGPPQCQDGIDNDNDGLTDLNDPGCATANDNDESDGTTACQDGVDNDGDGLIDLFDPGCMNSLDDNEFNNPLPECADGIDNDNDGLVDLADSGCTNANDDDESDPLPLTQCSDGIDNDGDNLIDLLDPGCANANDDDETDPTGIPQCNDGIDNDGDGLIDLLDPGCSDANDNDEFDQVITQCNDGVDNDGDGLIDLLDPGCENSLDNDEFDMVPQCADGIDNDNDGLVDLADSGCADANDDDERDPVSPPQCNDGIDNDGDGDIDLQDEGCDSSSDDSENSEPAEESSLHLTRIAVPDLFVSDAADIRAGGSLDVSVWLVNDGDQDMDSTRVQVFVPELGLFGSDGPFEVEEGERKRAQVQVPVYDDIQPGYYTMRISIRGSEGIRIKHREFLVQ